jgi:membrane associated rhomboid family serine protease
MSSHVELIRSRHHDFTYLILERLNFITHYSMEYVVTILLLITFIFTDISGVSVDSGVLSHFTYQFMHANLLHLVLNIYPLFLLIRLLKQLVNPLFLVLFTYMVSVLTSFIAIYPTPTVGASGVVYALLAVFLFYVKTKKINFQKKQYQFIFYFGVCAGMLISFFNTSSNFYLHLFSLLIAYTFFKSSYRIFLRVLSSFRSNA